MRKACMLIIAFAISISAVSSVFAAGKSAVTTFEGISKYPDPITADKVIKDNISVTPAYGRKVILYYYDTKTKAYTKVDEYKTENKKTATVQIIYPDTWKKKAISKWKIEAPSVKENKSKKITAKQAASQEVQIHNRTADKFTETKIQGAEASIGKSYNEEISDTITIKPAYGRTCRIYMYDQDTGKWVKKQEIQTKDKYEATVKIAYPNNWKAHYHSKWKIQVPKVAANEEKNLKKMPKAEIKTDLYNTYYSTLGKENETDNTFVSGIVMDAATGEIIFERGKDIRRRPASTTKIMTGILLTEKINSKSISKITISDKAKATVNRLYGPYYGVFKTTGETISPVNALYAMLLPSNNLMAESIGTSIAGSTDKFAKLMTQKAKDIGCRNTTFKDASGLDEAEHFSTAYDMAKIGQYVMNDNSMSTMRTVINTINKSVSSSKRSVTVSNTNPYIRDSDCKGIKTGTCYGAKIVNSANAAKNTFVGAFIYKKRMYITVIMNVPLGKTSTQNPAQKKEYTNRLKTILKYNVDQNISETHKSDIR